MVNQIKHHMNDFRENGFDSKYSHRILEVLYDHYLRYNHPFYGNFRFVIPVLTFITLALTAIFCVILREYAAKILLTGGWLAFVLAFVSIVLHKYHFKQFKKYFLNDTRTKERSETIV